jgi:hypothetical protein
VFSLRFFAASIMADYRRQCLSIKAKSTHVAKSPHQWNAFSGRSLTVQKQAKYNGRYMSRRKIQVTVWWFTLVVVMGSVGRADWPMVAHDPQRTSWAREYQARPATQIVWMRKVVPWIPTKAHIITVDGELDRPDMIFVPTVAAVYALRADNGAEVWTYTTHMPVGHSPTYADGRLYVACTDGRIHCLDADNGRLIWCTERVGGPFDVNPLVVEGRVFTGCRDGLFYSFSVSDGSLLWSFRTDGPISFSAAYADGIVYFAGYDCHAYALRVDTGKLVWKSPKLPGEGFYSFWPVITGDRVLLAGSNYYHIVGDGINRRSTKLEKLTRTDAWPEGIKRGDLVGPQDGQGWMNGGQFVRYLTKHPQRQTMHVLDRATGKIAQIAPLCWWGNPSGNRYPPVIGPQGIAYITAPWMYSPDFCKGRIAGWKIGTDKLFPLPYARKGLDSNDEPGAYAIIGNNAIYYNHKGD